MKHSISTKIAANLTMTPRLQRAIRMLQYSSAELAQDIEKMLADNPLLTRQEADYTNISPPNLDMHESSISRISQQKYCLTPGGVFALNYFFATHLSMSNGSAKDFKTTMKE